MTEQEIRDWEREIKHAEMMKKNSEGWDGKRLTIKATLTIPFNTYSIKGDNNEINR